MDEYRPWIVYNNICAMLRYRGASLSAAPLERDAFITRINQYEYVAITGVRLEEVNGIVDVRGPETITVILIKPKSNYSAKTAEFKKLTRGLTAGTGPKCFIYISEEPLKNQIAKLVDADSVATLEHYTYIKFIYEMPNYSGVPLHELVQTGDTSVDDWCELHKTTPAGLPRMRRDDTMAVWLGARPGMFVRVHRISETAGKAIVYRRVV